MMWATFKDSGFTVRPQAADRWTWLILAAHT
jgi:hypothetical protein